MSAPIKDIFPAIRYLAHSLLSLLAVGTKTLGASGIFGTDTSADVAASPTHAELVNAISVITSKFLITMLTILL
jgi:hypothetical protein